MKVATRPEFVLEMLSESSDLDEKLVETRLGSMVNVPRTLPGDMVMLRSCRVIDEVTPNEPSTPALLNTVARSPFDTAVEVLPALLPGSFEDPATREATAPESE
jgi:hypothetical protein